MASKVPATTKDCRAVKRFGVASQSPCPLATRKPLTVIAMIMMPRHVIAVNPDSLMVTPDPTSLDPIPALAVIPIIRPVVVIWAIAN